MAALKVITSNTNAVMYIINILGATCCYCLPFSQADMAALKVITSGSDPACYISSTVEAPHVALAHPSRTLRWPG
eukprot:7917471-Karenia_brevis.AAC.1